MTIKQSHPKESGLNLKYTCQRMVFEDVVLGSIYIGTLIIFNWLLRFVDILLLTIPIL